MLDIGIFFLGGRCVLKMDHHCPWINNCVGWGNHAHFIFFLMFATLGCLQASIILGCSLYKSIHRVHYFYKGEAVINFGLYGMILCVLALGFAVGVVIAVGMLLYFQVGYIVYRYIIYYICVQRNEEEKNHEKLLS